MQCLKSGVDNPGGSINTARPVPPPCSGAFFSGVFFFFPRCADGYVYDSCSRTHFVNIKKKTCENASIACEISNRGSYGRLCRHFFVYTSTAKHCSIGIRGSCRLCSLVMCNVVIGHGGGFSARRWPSTGVFQEPCHVHKCASALENVAHFACGNRVPHVVRRVVRPDLEQFTRAVLERSSRCSRSGLFDVGTNGRMGDRGPHGWDDE